MGKKIGLLLLLFTGVLYPQKAGLGKVTKAELKETVHLSDTTAPAAFLFKRAKTEFRYNEKDGFVSTTVFEIKLKIYKKEGLKWANFRIPYYIGYKTLEDEYVSIVSGYTYNLENDKIVKSKVTGEGKFKEQLNEYWEVKSVTFPNVKVGSVIELEYELKSQNLSMLPDFQYQYDIPVNYAEYESKIPEFYLYKGLKRGAVELDVFQELEATSQSFQSTVDKASISKVLRFNQIVTIYKATAIPALKEEKYVNNMGNYYGKIEQELQTIRYPEEKPKQIATTWESVAKSVYEVKEFDEATTKFDYFLNDLKFQLQGANTPDEKIRKVFEFVKKRMNWNEKYGYYPNKEMPAAYNEKVGNVAEINLMLLSMLKMAGIEADPVLVSTRDNGLAYFPNRSLFNYVIVSANYDNKTVLLDATNKYADFNVLPVRVLNGVGRLIKKTGITAEVNLMPNSTSEDVVSIIATINAAGEVDGKVRENYFNYNALMYRDTYNGLSKDSYVEKLESKYPGLEIIDFEWQNENDLSKPVTESYSFKATNEAEIIADKIYFTPLLFLALTQNPFKQEKRVYPIDFMFPNKYKINITINAPEGYEVESVPQTKALAMADQLGDFSYTVSNTKNKIQLLFSFNINQAVISQEYYEMLKTFYKEMINKQTEKVVLKKV